MIPISDENSTRRRGWLTMILIGLCTIVYFAVQPTGSNSFAVDDPRVQERELEFALDWAAVPCEVTKGRPLSVDEVEATFGGGDMSSCGVGDPTDSDNPNKPVFLALLVSMFLHGSIAHLAGNMLFLWIFGNNIEDRKGRGRFAALYVIGGLLADLTHVAVDPKSTVPVVGASGAIAAVMGAYLVLWPRARIKCVMPWGGLRKVSAGWVLGTWVASQFLIMVAPSNVSWGAHLGGFAVGAIAGWLWRVAERRDRADLAPPVPARL